MDTNMLERIASIKTSELEELPRIHIISEGALFQLMTWRNKNKEMVRSFNPVVNEGIISVISKDNYFYFLQYNDDIYMMKKVTDEEYVAFLYNRSDSTVKEIINTISFYPEDEVIQDILTVYASCMAYLNYRDITELDDGEIFTISEVLL